MQGVLSVLSAAASSMDRSDALTTVPIRLSPWSRGGVGARGLLFDKILRGMSGTRDSRSPGYPGLTGQFSKPDVSPGDAPSRRSPTWRFPVKEEGLRSFFVLRSWRRVQPTARATNSTRRTLPSARRSATTTTTTTTTTTAGFCRCVPLLFSHRGEPHHADQPVAVTSHGNLHAGPSGGLEPNATKNDDPCCPKGCAYSRTTSTMTSNAAAHNHSHEQPKTMK